MDRARYRLFLIAKTALVSLAVWTGSSAVAQPDFREKIYTTTNGGGFDRVSRDGSDFESFIDITYYSTGGAVLPDGRFYFGGLFPSSRLGIYSIALDGTQLRQVSDLGMPSYGAGDLDYDPVTGKVYFESSVLPGGAVWRMDPNGDNLEPLLTSPLLEVVLDVSFDFVNREMFLIGTPREFIPPVRIVRADLDGSNAVILRDSGSFEPAYRGLSVDPVTQDLFWFDTRDDTLRRMHRDGSGETILGSGFSQARASRVDEVERSLYYSRGATLYRADLDGSGITEIATMSHGIVSIHFGPDFDPEFCLDQVPLDCRTVPDGIDCAPAPAGLAHWWSLDAIADGQAAPSAGTTVGSVTSDDMRLEGAGVVGGAMYFDGESASVQLGSAQDRPSVGEADFSIAVWFRGCERKALQTFLGRRGPGRALEFGLGGGRPRLRLRHGSIVLRFLAPVDVIDGCWHHIVVTVDRDDPMGVRFWVDGEETGSPGDPTAIQGSLDFNSVYLGQSGNIRLSSVFSRLRGWLDEVQIYDRALSSSDVLAVYEAGSMGTCAPEPSPLPPDAAVWLTFDNPDPLFEDRLGCATPAASGGRPLRNAGIVGEALGADRVAWQNFSPHPCFDLGVESFTVEAWIRFTEDNPVSFVGWGNGNVNLRVIRHDSVDPNGRLLFTVRSPGPISTVSIDSPLALTSDWTHFAFVMNRGSTDVMTIYKDGVAVASKTIDLQGRVLSSDPVMQLHVYGATTASTAFVDEFTIYRRALDVSEIEAIVNAGSAGKQ